MKNLRYYSEGYGCAFNKAETGQICSLLEDNQIKKTPFPEKADILIVNTCAVKDTTEKRMLFRLKKLSEQKKSSALIIAFGCLAATRKKIIETISPEIVVLDTNLESLCRVLKIKPKKFSPLAKSKNKNSLVSIIPISLGCLGECTYCATKLARGNLKSYSEKAINNSFREQAKKRGEIWLTSQDSGCYGFDIKSSLPKLMKTLLKNKGDYFVRIGMMNPNHFLPQKKQIMKIFDDERVFRFLHLPLQSGSDSVLKKMNRRYTAEQFLECIKFARKTQPEISIATDVIAGFPGETEKDFQQTINILEKIKPDVINIARYSKRPDTPAAKMVSQLTEYEKKRRSKILTDLRNRILLEKNSLLVGKKFGAFVSEKKPDGQFVARTIFYKPVVVKSGYGKEIKVKLTEAHVNFLFGEVIK